MRITLIILILFIANSIFAERDDLRFFGYGTSDGISVGKVRKVFQDSKGFLWLATEDGLNRFDGYKFDVFRNQQNDSTSISSNKIWDITEDNKKRLWIATGYGLNSYNLITGKFTTYIKDSSTNLSDNEVRSLYVCQDSILFIGTHGGGLNVMDLKTLKISKVSLPQNPTFIRKINCIDGQILLGTHGNNFYTLNPQTMNARQVTIDKNHETQYVDQVSAFLRIDDQRRWVATENGIFEWNNKTGEVQDITPKHLFNENEVLRVRDFLRDKDGIIWVTTNQGLLKYKSNYWYRYTTNEEEDYSLRSNWLVDIFEDESGSIWISNKENGVNVIHNKQQKFRHYGSKAKENSLSNNLVFSFAKYDSNEILVGTIGGGLDGFNPWTEKFYDYNKYHPALSNQITDIYVEAYNDIWLGSWGNGLQYFNPETGEVRNYREQNNNPNSISNNTIICIRPAKKGNYWIGTFDGLNYFDPDKENFTRYQNIEGLNSHTIFYIYSKHPDTLWLGTRGGGLAKLDLQSMQVKSYQHDSRDTTTIANNVVKYIHEDHNGYFWIATEMGISRFNPQTGKFRNYNINDGLPNNNVWAILPDSENNLWLSTNSGIARITLDSASNIVAVKSYQKNEGLKSLEFSQGAYLRDPASGTLYFGGTEGFYAFNPEQIKPRQYEPPVRLTSIKVMDKELEGDTLPSSKRKVVIPWHKNFISFEFVGLDYAHQGNIQYKYKMVGQSDKWSQPSTRTFASFPDLQDGEYTFKVRATNSEGIWPSGDKGEVSIRIRVKPPWWRTTLAYILYIILPVIGVIIYIRIRTRKLQREKRILEEIVAERTAELRKKNLDITSSIQYAQRIQQAIIYPSITDFSEEFRNVFVLFKPKDIVSGDFFWYIKKGTTRIFTAADCTGHGVPGAFMSIIGNNLLNQIVTEEDITDPAEILTELDEKIKQSLNQKGRKSDTFDGMDMAICAIDEGSNELTFSGAYNPLYHIRNKELSKYKVTRRSIGGSQLISKKPFFNHKIQVEKGDTIYIFSDGYADQFGGPRNRKFTSKKLQEKLISIQDQNMPNQQMTMEDTIDTWMEDYEQIDDMILVGVRF
ncbi:MAG TPA: two-component regulator propeller domain-containing protein [Salinivirga sp.]|uniref:ligand-binding sensor domain-containing protein n=1 Tax=Salinivirga sp. TaxID=1970192 RepID=UPI002B459F38|nr:two-component regulator propeller domain-containing protein [Salinivirga sp.]HKK58425.1 two-component regulator propeller domain-containing protein [Salinivirga sp.]